MDEDLHQPILQSQEEEKTPIKLILCGDYGSGKTSMLERHIYRTFCEDEPSKMKKRKVKLNIKVRNEKETLLISDTNGEEKYQSLQINHFINAHCAIIVFDVSNESSFESVEYWFKIIKLYEPDIPILVAGNKSDKRIEISYERALKICEQYGSELIYCSAKTGKKVNKVFRRIVHLYFNVKDEGEIQMEETKEEPVEKSHCLCCC